MMKTMSQKLYNNIQLVDIFLIEHWKFKLPFMELIYH